VSQPDPRDAIIAEQAAIIAELRARLDRAEARIADLERQLGRNSGNSSMPPSSDGPGVKLPSRKAPTGRRPGGQPGRRGRYRALLPTSKVDEVVHHWPSECAGCDLELPTSARRDAGRPARHQVTELPVVRAQVTEHQLHAQRCARCTCVTVAELPVGVPRGAFGTRLAATVAVLTGVYRLSKRNVEGICGTLFGVDLSLGAVSALEQRVSAALAAPYAEARAHVRAQPTVHADETGWRERRARAWLWVAVTRLIALFAVHRRRSRAAAEALLGNYKGRLVSDRWSAYSPHKTTRRQLCWAHIKRDFQWIADHRGAAGRLGAALLAVQQRVFVAWHAFRDGTITRRTLRRTIDALALEIDTLLKCGMRGRVAKVAGMCREIWTLSPALWTFAKVDGVEPTNNAAERALRHAVILRKTSFGTHSEAGSRFVERILTVVTSLKLQARDVLEYLVRAVDAASRSRKAPSLVGG